MYFVVLKPPTSFLQAMEEYVKEAPLAAGAKKEQVMEKLAAPKEILAIEYEKPPKEVEEKPESPEPPVKAEAEAEKPAPVEKQPDLLVSFPFSNYNLGPFFFFFLDLMLTFQLFLAIVYG